MLTLIALALLVWLTPWYVWLPVTLLGWWTWRNHPV
jgi:hypothetical protein